MSLESLLNRRMDRRTLLKGAAVGGAGLAVGAIVGCGGGETKVTGTTTPIGNTTETSQPTQIQTPEQTPKKEGLSDTMGLVPLEVFSHTPPQSDPGSFEPLKEGFRWVNMRFAIRNISDRPLELTKQFIKTSNDQLSGVTITTAQGFDYPVSGSHSEFLSDLISDTSSNKRVKIPPGFELEHIGRSNNSLPIPEMEAQTNTDQYYGGMLINDAEWNRKVASSAILYTFQVPQNATGLKLNIPGYESLMLDEVTSRTSESAFPDTHFPDPIGGSVMDPDHEVKITIKDFQKADIQLTFPDADPSVYPRFQVYKAVLSYANLNQGNTMPSRIRIFSIDQEGGFYTVTDPNDNNAETPGWFGEMGFDEIGPGFSKDLEINLVFPASVTAAKFVLQGKELGVFNIPIS